MDHLEFTQLLRLFEGAQLTSAERTHVETHLAECSDCLITYRKLAAFFEHAGMMKSEAVPQATTARLINIFQPRPRVYRSGDTRHRPFIVFDDWSSLVFERHGSIDTRHLLYRAGEYELELQIEFLSDRCEVQGQLLPDAPDVRIDICGLRGSSSSVVSSGEFRFGPLQQGKYDIVITIGETKIEFPNVPLQQ